MQYILEIMKLNLKGSKELQEVRKENLFLKFLIV